MVNIRLRSFVLGAFLLLSFGEARPAAVLEDVIEKTYAVEPTVKFSIRNDEGSIFIYGSDVAEMKMQAIKKAYNRDRLAKISVNVSAQSGEVSIDTQYPPKPKWGWSDRSGTVDYVIVLPWTCHISRLELGNGEILVDGMRGDNVHANLGNGRMFGHNCFTDLHLSVAKGGLDIVYDWWETHKFSVNAQIANGNVRVLIPGEASFHLSAASVTGHVASDFTEQEQRRQEGFSKVDTVINGESEVELKIHADDGNIKIEEANP
jgi:hypothetical protein